MPHHASMKTGKSEASSNIAITILNTRTTRTDVSQGRSALPNSAQATHDIAPIHRLMATWIRIFQGKLAIAAYAVMVPITITQPLTLTHWKIAAPQNVMGPRALSWPDAPGPDIAITAAR